MIVFIKQCISQEFEKSNNTAQELAVASNHNNIALVYFFLPHPS